MLKLLNLLKHVLKLLDLKNVFKLNSYVFYLDSYLNSMAHYCFEYKIP